MKCAIDCSVATVSIFQKSSLALPFLFLRADEEIFDGRLLVDLLLEFRHCQTQQRDVNGI
jgi:hypothetical protein